MGALRIKGRNLGAGRAVEAKRYLTRHGFIVIQEGEKPPKKGSYIIVNKDGRLIDRVKR